MTNPVGEKCSTPEGVIVAITPKRRSLRRQCRADPVLNARRRHRRDHDGPLAFRGEQVAARASCSTPEGVIVAIATAVHHADVDPVEVGRAQRPKASSSRSRRQGGLEVDTGSSLLCSTPEGVIVAITPLTRTSRHRVVTRAAQRPKASSSRSQGNADRAESSKYRASAQRPKASSSRSPNRSIRRGRSCTTAQRPKASTCSNARVANPVLSGDVVLHDARRRHRLDRDQFRADDLTIAICSTPEGVIVAITRVSTDHGFPKRRQVLNARRRHRRDHSRRRLERIRPLVTICSTPEGVIVAITDDSR